MLHAPDLTAKRKKTGMTKRALANGIATVSLLLATACGERMDMPRNDTGEAQAETAPDLASNASAIAAYARSEIAARAPEITAPTNALNGRICAAAMERFANAVGVRADLRAVDGNTTTLVIAGTTRECLVDRDRVVWRDVPRQGRPGPWHDDGIQYRIDAKGRIEITGRAR